MKKSALLSVGLFMASVGCGVDGQESPEKLAAPTHVEADSRVQAVCAHLAGLFLDLGDTQVPTAFDINGKLEVLGIDMSSIQDHVSEVEDILSNPNLSPIQQRMKSAADSARNAATFALAAQGGDPTPVLMDQINNAVSGAQLELAGTYMTSCNPTDVESDITPFPLLPSSLDPQEQIGPV